MHKLIRYSIYSLTALVALLASSCQDDFNYSNTVEVEEGLPVTVKLRVQLPAMSVQSRSDISDDQANRVESIWVGVFNKSGNLTGDTIENTATTDIHQPYEIKLEAKTGESRIVAVANLDLPAMKKGDENQTTLRALLNNENLTWDEFCEIAYCLPASGTVDNPLGLLPMAGFYANAALGDQPHGLTWGEEMGDETFIIAPPTTGNNTALIKDTKGNNLNGYIHLRRLHSQVKFNIRVPAEITNLTIEPYSWQVVNVPELSLLHEQATNASDVFNEENIAQYYADSYSYTTEYFSHNTNDGIFSFDYWQLENKRTGNGTIATYADREKESKNTDGTNNDANGKPDYVNLEGNNKYASYVVIKCRLNYTEPLNPGNGYEHVEDAGTIRTADATYVIHLGAIGYTNNNTDPDILNDFNNHRNTIYTYNVYVRGVNDIVVEAWSEDGAENRPGAEGIVTDLSNPTITLDCHYSMVNMKFTDAELTNNEGRMGFLIHAFDKDNKLIEIDENSYNDVDQKYVEWIEVRPTTSEDIYADYLPHGGNNDTRYIYELQEFANHNDAAEHWYTVFINEYAYESTNTSSNWKEYVNKSNRGVWFKTVQAQSPDKGSTHLKAKYALQQRSIQTYYNTTSDNVKSAIGVEHLNETFGARLRYPSTVYSYVNGRANVLSYLGLANSGTANKSWNDYVTTTVYSVPQITNQGNYPGLEVYVGKPAIIANPQPTTISVTRNNRTLTLDPTYSDNSYNNYYVEVLNACMNRNRDLNGNKVIDANEVKWYVPSSSQYQRIILGRRSLTSPIMQDYDNITLANSSNARDDINNHNTRYHYAGSDNYKIWTEEGLSKSLILNLNWQGALADTWQLGAWQVRCVRNLGLDDTETNPANISIPAAYYNDPDQGTIFRMDNYAPINVREYPLDQMPPHNIYNQDYNRIYSAFQISNIDIPISGFIPGHTDDYTTTVNNSQEWTDYLSDETKDPCAQVNQNLQPGERKWRVPNQKELTMMFANGKLTANLQYISATHEFFNYAGVGYIVDNTVASHYGRRYLGTNGDNPFAINFKDGNNFYIRCVRDYDN